MQIKELLRGATLETVRECLRALEAGNPTPSAPEQKGGSPDRTAGSHNAAKRSLHRPEGFEGLSDVTLSEESTAGARWAATPVPSASVTKAKAAPQQWPNSEEVALLDADGVVTELASPRANVRRNDRHWTCQFLAADTTPRALAARTFLEARACPLHLRTTAAKKIDDSTPEITLETVGDSGQKARAKEPDARAHPRGDARARPQRQPDGRGESESSMANALRIAEALLPAALLPLFRVPSALPLSAERLSALLLLRGGRRTVGLDNASRLPNPRRPGQRPPLSPTGDRCSALPPTFGTGRYSAPPLASALWHAARADMPAMPAAQRV